MACTGDMLAEEINRDFKMNTGTITSFTISIDSTAVPDSLQGFDPFFDNFTARLAINRGNKTDTAGCMFHFRRPDTGGFETVFHLSTLFKPCRSRKRSGSGKFRTGHYLVSSRGHLVGSGSLLPQPLINAFGSIATIAHRPDHQ